jgi:phosphohistidine phosphatase SixA
VIVFVLRHADRQPAPNDDLTPAGEKRAELLARMLAESGITTAYHSGTVRARRTLEPLKLKLGNALTVAGIESEDEQATVDAVKSRPADEIVAVVGHSNTVGPIIKGLGSDELVGPIGPDEFDKLFILFIDPTGKVTLLRLRY